MRGAGGVDALSTTVTTTATPSDRNAESTASPSNVPSFHVRITTSTAGTPRSSVVVESSITARHLSGRSIACQVERESTKQLVGTFAGPRNRRPTSQRSQHHLIPRPQYQSLLFVASAEISRRPALLSARIAPANDGATMISTSRHDNAELGSLLPRHAAGRSLESVRLHQHSAEHDVNRERMDPAKSGIVLRPIPERTWSSSEVTAKSGKVTRRRRSVGTAGSKLETQAPKSPAVAISARATSAEIAGSTANKRSRIGTAFASSSVRERTVRPKTQRLNPPCRPTSPSTTRYTSAY